MSRTSVCFVAPGHTLWTRSGSARNMLAVAEALSQWTDVTVAFRDVAEPIANTRFEVIAIESRPERFGVRDDVAARGLNPFSHLSYLQRLHEFVAASVDRYDLVLEKGWRLSGVLAHAFSNRGVAAALIENDVRCWNEPLRDPRTFAKYLVHRAAQSFAGYHSRRLSLIFAETEELSVALQKERRISAERIEVVGLGVDHKHFRPMDQAEARVELGIGQNKLVLLYVGGMDLYHDLSPLLDALRDLFPPELELHLVGDGEYRARYEALTKASRGTIRFHGQVAHERVPQYIAAADVCLAPYQTRAFHAQAVNFFTLKIPEYMACERPVISVPSGHIKRLISDGETGFLLANEKTAWERFLRQPPSRETLAAMGRRAAPTVASLSWANTARAYLARAGFDPADRSG